MTCRYSNAKYMMIAETIARKLRAGDFPPDDPFYSRDELARAYHISPGTARAVLRVLVDRGVIACRKGKRPIPSCPTDGEAASSVCRPVFFRDSYLAETPEYDYLAYCMRNLLMRRRTGFLECNADCTDAAVAAAFSAGDVAVVFPSPVEEKEPSDQCLFQLPSGRVDLLIDRARNDAVSIFTRKAGLDCLLHLIRQDFAAVLHVTSKRSAFPWFDCIAAPDVLAGYAPGCRAETVLFDDEPELFPDFLTETVSGRLAQLRGSVAILIDDPYLSDSLSCEIRTGAYRPPSRCSFFGTAFCERSMVFPYLDLKLDALAVVILRTAFTKVENPGAVLACDFHLIQFRVPGIG